MKPGLKTFIGFKIKSIIEFCNRRIISAHHATTVSLYLDRAERHTQPITYEQTVYYKIADPEEIFYSLRGLDSAEKTGDASDDSCLLRARVASGRWRGIEYTAITCAARNAGKGLPTEPHHPCMRKRDVLKYARIIDEKFCGEVVGGIYHEITAPYEIPDIT